MKPLHIGITANFMYPEEAHLSYAPKTLVYAEEELLLWVEGDNAIPVLLPALDNAANMYGMLESLDGIIFSGGADISPVTYNEKALSKKWEGDKKRDRYEIKLLNTALEMKKPVLGICRGMQIINVALGGTMVQDIPTQIPQASAHKDKKLYDQYTHEISIEPDCTLSAIYDGKTAGKVNSIHHQAIKDLGKDLIVQARTTDGRVIEAVTLDRDDQYLLAVQWHPEWIKDPALLAPGKIRDHFFSAIHAQKT